MRTPQLIVRICFVLAFLAEPTLLLAQSSNKQPVSKNQPSGLKYYEKGARSFETGKYDSAIQLLTSSLSEGGLTSQQMAKALYYRGLAYRKQGKSALAISDLTSSIWLKSGLSDTERAVAIDQRQAAYREAGLGDGIAIGSAPLGGPSSIKTADVNGDKNQPSISGAVPYNDKGSSTWSTGSSSTNLPNSQNPPFSPTIIGPSAVSGSSIKGEEGLVAKASQPLNTATSADKISIVKTENKYSPSEAGAESISNGGNASEEPGFSTLVGLLSNIFGSGNTSENKAPSEDANSLATSSTKQVVMPPLTQPAVTDWNTTVANTNSRNLLVNRDQGNIKSVNLTEKTQGKYRLQVAVLRSRNKAEDIASEIRKKYGNDLGTAVTAIDEVVYGNMGKFYRLQLGPYINAAAAGNLCNILKPQGYDCMVVTQ